MEFLLKRSHNVWITLKTNGPWWCSVSQMSRYRSTVSWRADLRRQDVQIPPKASLTAISIGWFFLFFFFLTKSTITVSLGNTWDVSKGACLGTRRQPESMPTHFPECSGYGEMVTFLKDHGDVYTSDAAVASPTYAGPPRPLWSPHVQDNLMKSHFKVLCSSFFLLVHSFCLLWKLASTRAAAGTSKI